jgi:N-sulfoglucosamine sulfohydrolase
MNRNYSFLLIGASLLGSCIDNRNIDAERPNILWVILDDTGTDFSCYGNQLIHTPVFDSLATNGVLFTRMHVTSPVCSPARSALMTGMYPTSNGTHQHRSSRGDEVIFIDNPLVPEIFKNAGYFTGNVGYDYNAKTDYNFVWNPNMYNVRHRIEENNWISPWKGRDEGQPFFIQIQLEGGKNRRVAGRYPVDPAKTSPAPYYPDDLLFNYDQASYHSSTLHVDKLLGDIMHHLKSDGLDRNTVVMVLGDNGQDNYRDKQWLYQGGTHVPFVVYGPEKYVGKRGQVREDLAIHIDMVASSLAMAKISLPSYLEGVDLFADDYTERDYIVTARDRCDWTQDRIRAVISRKHKYIKNFHPERPYMQSNYRDEWNMVVQAKEMFANNELNPVQARFFQSSRPAEEFYLLGSDQFETNNQIDNSLYQKEIAAMRDVLDTWIESTDDKGQYPETEASIQQALRHVNTGENKRFPLIAGPSALSISGDTASFFISGTNLSNKTLAMDIKIMPTAGFWNFNGIQTLYVPAGETGRVEFKKYIYPLKPEDSIHVKIITYYTFSDKSGNLYTWDYTLKPAD